MSPHLVSHLEPLPHFVKRLAELHALHDPEDPVLANLDAKDEESEAAWARRKIATIYRYFPLAAPPADQAAYFVRAMTGMRPFASANFRTAMDLLNELAEHGSHKLIMDQREAEELGNELWDELGLADNQELSRNALGDKDDVYEMLRAWFAHRIQ